jgi:hypothetical protein
MSLRCVMCASRNQSLSARRASHLLAKSSLAPLIKGAREDYWGPLDADTYRCGSFKSLTCRRNSQCAPLPLGSADWPSVIRSVSTHTKMNIMSSSNQRVMELSNRTVSDAGNSSSSFHSTYVTGI